jgi:mycofactocin system glycosyltransferase
MTPNLTSTTSLPNGFIVDLDPRMICLDGGRLLVGGSPLTAMRLSAVARTRILGQRLTVTDAASAQVAERLVATNLAHPVMDPAAESSAHELTVVVPVRDRAEQLDRCLSALSPLNVIVVDDASHDPAAVAAVAKRHDASLVTLTTNVGPAGARNAGLARVTTPVVAFVDSDVEATAAALIGLTAHFADISVALVGPRVIGRARRPRPHWFERYDAAVSSLTLGPKPYSVRPGAGVAWLPSACLVARTDRLGTGFDPGLRVGEDVDLVWRLVDAGHRVRYEPAITVSHDVRPTMRGWLGRKALYGSGGALLAERHGSHVAPAVLSPTLAIAGAAVLLRRSWSFPVASTALAYAGVSVARTLPPDLNDRTRARVATRLGVRGVGWAVRQESSLLLRHWWPLTAVVCTAYPPARRSLASALVVDTIVAVAEHFDHEIDVTTLVLGRRLEDCAYGAGLWWGAVRARSAKALLPRRPGDAGRN